MAVDPTGQWRRLGLILGVLVLAALAVSRSGSPARATVVDYEPLRQQVQAFVESRPQRIGIYFKDLTSQQTWGIDEELPIPAASTVKVPIALYVNELVAQGRLRWSDRVRYERDLDLAGGAGVLQYDGIDGGTYSLRVLTNLLITISDNVAWRMLTRHLGKENIAAFMRSLGGRTVYPDGQNISTARDMGIYMEAVLGFAERQPELGERLLDDLAHTIWHVGLPGELPTDVRVAHKEGDITGVADDVGVVFARRPYILAIMSEGVPDIETGFADVARISRMVYDFQERLAGR
ncbi:serine hydrolase [Geochorda subterranea]|uniref:Serine hydrolase n=1 Tax=Geochorda subterranea TaxID=3109564 RepID=A0ABZ1BSE0_9FIRM|nr:serine hydrolase [Limnochorda sp. LNt]WRP15082.1 serine hydrolase [Limnochorda sp. LNt]